MIQSLQLEIETQKVCVLLQRAGKSSNEKGVKIAAKKLEAVCNWPVPKTKSELSTFVGFASYHHNHIAHFAEIAACLSHMTGP